MFPARRRRPAPTPAPTIDRLGRPIPTTNVMHPLNRTGVAPPNKGLQLPGEVYTDVEVAALLRSCGKRGSAALRMRALIVVLWRAGLRIDEALSLQLADLDPEAGTILVRRGKGAKRRMVGMDAQAFALLDVWLARRSDLGVARGRPVFCTITKGNLGNRLGDANVRERLKELAAKAQIDKRVHPHGFRHTCAVNMERDGVPLTMIQKQLGHSELATTARYLDHLLPRQLVDRMRVRAWPDEFADVA